MPVNGFKRSRLGTSFLALMLPPVCTKLAAELATAATATNGKLMRRTAVATAVGDAGSLGWCSAADNKAEACSVASETKPPPTDRAAMKPTLWDRVAET